MNPNCTALVGQFPTNRPMIAAQIRFIFDTRCNSNYLDKHNLNLQTILLVLDELLNPKIKFQNETRKHFVKRLIAHMLRMKSIWRKLKMNLAVHTGVVIHNRDTVAHKRCICWRCTKLGKINSWLAPLFVDLLERSMRRAIVFVGWFCFLQRGKYYSEIRKKLCCTISITISAVNTILR